MRVFISLFVATGAWAQTVIGIVGQWKADGAPVRFGDPVQPHSIITATAPGSILIGSERDKKPFRFFQRCEKAQCRFDLWKDSKPDEPAGLFARLRAAIQPYAKPDLIAAISREWGRELTEAVAPLQNGQLDLTPALTAMDPGLYRLRLKPMHAGSPAKTLSVEWKRGSAALVPAAEIRAGIYKLALLEPNDEPTGTEAWVLATGDVQTAALFQEVVEGTESWKDDLDASAVQGVRRAYLLSLASHKLK